MIKNVHKNCMNENVHNFINEENLDKTDTREGVYAELLSIKNR